MSRLKKFFFIASIGLNVILLGFFILLLGKFAHYGRGEMMNTVSQATHPPSGIPGYNKMPPRYLKEKKRAEDKYCKDDDGEEAEEEGGDEEEMGRKLARKLACDIFSETEIRQNFDQLSAFHHELMLIVSSSEYDEQKVRSVFASFSETFGKNKKIIEEKLILSLRGLTPEKRTGLIKAFLRSRVY